MTRNLENWLLSYLAQKFIVLFKRRPRAKCNIVFLVVDHFEPYWQAVDKGVASERVRSWAKQLPMIAGKHHDANGRHPKYTFFYPQEEYDPELLDMLATLSGNDLGEVEIHLHHDNDTSAETRKKLLSFKDVLFNRHGLLSTDRFTGEIRYGFIHGNWALDNSRKDGRWCGVNDELTILEETGCYADFTLPSAPSDTQTKKINSIYYAIDDPAKPKSHDRGVDVMAGIKKTDGLLLVQGPLGFNWRSRKLGLLPRIENGALAYDNPVTMDRIGLWVSLGPRIQGNDDTWLFIKLHTHGCQERNMEYLLSGGLDSLYSSLESFVQDDRQLALYYVSARETYNLIKALEADAVDESDGWRDYCLLSGR
jgi:hypothetical protein